MEARCFIVLHSEAEGSAGLVSIPDCLPIHPPFSERLIEDLSVVVG